MAPAPRSGWRRRFSKVCSSFMYACCEPSSENLYDDDEQQGSSVGRSDLDGRIIHVKVEDQEVPKQLVSSFESSQAVSRKVPGDRHRLVKRKAEESRPDTQYEEKEDVYNYDGCADSPATDVTRVASLTIEDFSMTNEEKTPISDDAGKRRSSRGRQGSRGRKSSTPPRHPTSKSRWSDEILEGFLYSTLVDGSGLVLDKLDSDGKGKKSGERILSYDPDTMRVKWVSTGMRRKPGSMFAKDIDEVLCDGTCVTILYSQPTSTGGALRRVSMSPMRRSSLSARLTANGRRRKVFQTTQDRDARILTELLRFVRRKSLVAFSAEVSKLGASASVSPAISAVGFYDSDEHDNDSEDGGVASTAAKSHSFAVAKSRSFDSVGARLGGTGGLGRGRRRSGVGE